MSAPLWLSALVLAPTLPPAHPDSLSSSSVNIDGEVARVELHCQLLSLAEVVDGLDANADGVVDDLEFDDKSAEIRAYVESHYRLVLGADDDLEGGEALPVTSFHARWVEPASRLELGNLDGGARIEFECRADEPIHRLVLEVTLFHDTSPDHIDLATVHFEDGRVDSFGVMREVPRVRAGRSGRTVFGTFLRLGFDHILSGWDHLAFVALLLLGARTLRTLVAIVTAFTVAHSFTLAAAALKLVDVSVFSAYVEALIALSIAYVGCMNVLGGVSTRARWIETFAFGLLHGLGFAGFLGRSLMGEHSKASALASFNVGIELGQLLAVGAMMLVLAPMIRRTSDRETIVPPVVRVGLSVPLSLLGLWWFVERIWL